MKTQPHILQVSVFSRRYWYEAAKEFTRPSNLAFAAIIIALRIGVKFFKIPLVGNELVLGFDCYVNSVGSMIYGPLAALVVGLISDNLGFILSPSGIYFPAFTLVEMMSGFLFALFFWRRQITVTKSLTAKFSVNLICNIIMNSLFMKWQYYLLGDQKLATYHVVNSVRIVKNLVLFPLEAVLIVLLISALIPALRQLKVIPKEQKAIRWNKWDVALVVLFFLLSVWLILFYVFFLKGWVSANKIVFF